MNPEQPKITDNVLFEVVAERTRQETKWGQQEHNPSDYYLILAEEYGEVAKEIVEYNANEAGPYDAGYIPVRRLRLNQMRKELIQTAAVAVAFVERIDRMVV